MNPNQVVASDASGIKSLEDIKGKHFAVASAGSSVYNECAAHFTTLGMKFPDDIKAELINFTDAADMLQNGTLDGARIMSGAPASAVAQALTAKCHLVNIPKATIDKFGDDGWTSPEYSDNVQRAQQALKAYEDEQKKAKVPRIIIDKSVLSFYDNPPQWYKNIKNKLNNNTIIK